MSHARLDTTLLESKLFPAAGTGRPLARPRIDAPPDVLDGACPVVLLTAPAGYGDRKSVV